MSSLSIQFVPWFFFLKGLLEECPGSIHLFSFTLFLRLSLISKADGLRVAALYEISLSFILTQVDKFSGGARDGAVGIIH